MTGIATPPGELLSLPASPAPILFQMDIRSVLTWSALPVILTFLVTDIFDTLGTLTGLGLRAGLYSRRKSRALQQSIEADAVGTLLSGFAGVTSTTPFIENAAGVEAGGRTGWTAVVTGLLFLLPLFMLPFFKAVPSFAIYPVLVLVGAAMFGELKHIDFDDPAVRYSTFFTVMGMPLFYSITDGLLLGAIVYAGIKVTTSGLRGLSPAMRVLAVAAALLFFVL